jgi:hypothetical protein
MRTQELDSLPSVQRLSIKRRTFLLRELWAVDPTKRAPAMILAWWVALKRVVTLQALILVH